MFLLGFESCMKLNCYWFGCSIRMCMQEILLSLGIYFKELMLNFAQMDLHDFVLMEFLRVMEIFKQWGWFLFSVLLSFFVYSISINIFIGITYCSV